MNPHDATGKIRFRGQGRDGEYTLKPMRMDLKALEQREAERYWSAHEARYPARPGDDLPEGEGYDSMDDLLAELGDS